MPSDTLGSFFPSAGRLDDDEFGIFYAGSDAQFLGEGNMFDLGMDLSDSVGSPESFGFSDDSDIVCTTCFISPLARSLYVHLTLGGA